ncbi:MAG: hypothetical protein HY507_01275 [Candidatus Zambryskibacteria bacterium]|nr:hypothetical protein [Candidatus Zambryskibacteria bacterium]
MQSPDKKLRGSSKVAYPSSQPRTYIPLNPEGKKWYKGALEAYKAGNFKEFEVISADLDNRFNTNKRWFTFLY